MKEKCLNILYQCDNNFAFLAGVSITSLLVNANKDIYYHIYILTPDMSEENKKKYMSLKERFPNIKFDISFLDASYCENEVKSWNVPDHRGSYVTYYKLLIDHFFKGTDVSRIIHIGADSLVTGDLSELIDFEFDGKPFAMNWSEKKHNRYVPLSYKYCVAEMVYFNLPEWRKHNCEERIKKWFLEVGDKSGEKDQGVLNIEFQEERQQLPLKYNIYGITFFFSFRNKCRFNAAYKNKEEVRLSYENPQIIRIPRTFLYRPHEEGSVEPLKEMWWEYCKESPWYDLKPIKSYPPLGRKEKFLRYMYLHLPKYIAEWFYVLCRYGYGLLNAILFPPKGKLQIGMKTE